MIELDRTEMEQEELVKQWIKDYWLMVVAVIVFTIAIVYGISYWRQSKLDTLSNLGEQAETVSQHISKNNVSEAKKLVSNLQSQEATSSFSAIATMEIAKKYYDDGAFLEAITQYDWLISNSESSELRDIAKLRKARVQSSFNKQNDAIATLSSIESKRYVTQANMLKGDLLFADKQFEEAKKTYESTRSDDNINADLLQKKIDLIEIMQQKARL